MVTRAADVHHTSEQLPALAMSRPMAARTRAQILLQQSTSSVEHTYALQTLGIVAREEGDIRQAISHFRRGLVISEESGLPARAGDLAGSLGYALALAGRKHASYEAFDRALLSGDRVSVGRVLVRRCAARIMFGDLQGAYSDGQRAARILHQERDRNWEARARNNAAHALLQLGRYAEADRQYALAEEIALAEGQEYDAAIITHSRGDAAHRQGDLPRALRMLYRAHDWYQELGVVPPEIVRDLAIVALASGLTEEATAAADELVETLERDRLSAGQRAEGMAAAAMAHLDHGNIERAVELARKAARASHRQGDVQGEWHARLVMLRAQAANGRVTKRHALTAARLAAEIQDRYSADRLEAQVLAGRLARRTGLDELAVQEFTAASAQRRRGSALRRAAAWLATAQLADIRGDRRGVLRACERGLTVLETHALSLGATELRARATSHGIDLVRTAIGQVIDNGSARDLLRWTERWRSILHAAPNRQVRRDPALAAELAKLREADGDIGVLLDRDREASRQRVEERIRRLTREATGGPAPRRPFDIAGLLAELGDHTTLVGVLTAGGHLHVVVTRRGRLRRFEAGRLDDARRDVEYARFALRGASVASESVAAALLTALEPALRSLEHTLLGPATLRAIGDGPVVLMPPATLQSAPWGALPSLRDRTVTVTPSATAWLRARATPEPRRHRVALITGPALETVHREVAAVAALYPHPTVLTGDDATCGVALRALDGASLAHVAAHGRFRGDNPMFSALELADGPLTVYDVEGLRRPPYRLLLTACESGVGSPTGADELLGLASSLTALGTAGLLASIVPVNDEATVPFSVTVHERLRAGDDFGRALLAARLAAVGPVARATAWSFLALGAA